MGTVRSVDQRPGSSRSAGRRGVHNKEATLPSTSLDPQRVRSLRKLQEEAEGERDANNYPYPPVHVPAKNTTTEKIPPKTVGKVILSKTVPPRETGSS